MEHKHSSDDGHSPDINMDDKYTNSKSPIQLEQPLYTPIDSRKLDLLEQRMLRGTASRDSLYRDSNGNDEGEFEDINLQSNDASAEAKDVRSTFFKLN